MLPMLGWLRLGAMGAVLVAGWFLYGWGSEVIGNYGRMAAKIERLERDKALIESRVASLRVLNERRDAAIEASRCKDQIKNWLKNPDEIPTKFDPFNQLR